MQDENTFSSRTAPPVPVAVWGAGNMGRAAIRGVLAHPGLRLAAVLTHDAGKVGRDAAELAGLTAPSGVTARPLDDVPSVLAGLRDGAVAYMASGDLRGEDALADVCGALAAGVDVVTPSLYELYDPRGAAPAVVRPAQEAAHAGGSSLLVSGIDPGWANDVLPVLASGLTGRIREVRCQEIFDYSDYDAEHTVRALVGMGGPMDVVPPMVAPGIPTMVWGGQVRLLARALGLELEAIRERVERCPLDADATTRLGFFARGTQGALRFEVQGIVAGRPVVVIEHITRIVPTCALAWPLPPDGADGAHRVILDGDPRLELTIEASTEEGRAAGGNATAAWRLLDAVPWLKAAPPGLYDALDVPLRPAVGRFDLSPAIPSEEPA